MLPSIESALFLLWLPRLSAGRASFDDLRCLAFPFLSVASRVCRACRPSRLVSIVRFESSSLLLPPPDVQGGLSSGPLHLLKLQGASQKGLSFPDHTVMRMMSWSESLNSTIRRLVRERGGPTRLEASKGLIIRSSSEPHSLLADAANLKPTPSFCWKAEAVVSISLS